MGAEALLEPAWHAAQRRWPAVTLTLEQYAQHVDGLGVGRQDLHLEDLYLAAAATRGDAAALAAFDAEALAAVGRQVSRIDASAEFADEVRQALRVRLLVGEGGEPPRIATYSGQGPIGGWVRVAALRLALNLKRIPAPSRSTEEVLELAATGNPELDLLVARSRATVEAAVRSAFAALPREDRTLLRLHLYDDLSIDELAKLYQIHRSTAARRISACRQRVVEQVLTGLRDQLSLPPSDLASLLGLVRSRLELSLGELLATLQ